MKEVALVLFYLITPLFVLYFCEKFAIIRKLGAVLLCYFIGIILGNSIEFSNTTKALQDNITSVSVLLSIPLLLISINVKKSLSMAKSSLISFLLALLSVLIVVIVGFYLFRNTVDEAWKVAGMLVGVYTGGTPNIASIKTALDVNAETFLIVHTYDMIISAVYILFLISVGSKFFALFLRKYQKNTFLQEENQGNKKQYSLKDDIKKEQIFSWGKALGITVLVLLIAVSLSLLFPSGMQTLIVILTVTSLSLILSIIPAINKLKRSYDLGMYFILVFSLCVASMADFSNLGNTSPYLFLFVCFVVFVSLIIHAILSKIAGVDKDTMMICSTAMICSPPFVLVVAASIKNKEIIVAGISVGIIGYAIGNYLGISMAYFLEFL